MEMTGNLPKTTTKPIVTHYYRVAVYDDYGRLLETTDVTEFYSEAHLTSFNWNDEYPAKQAVVERSTDNQKTWHDYMADEYINGAPAWVHHQELWRNHK